TGVVGIEGRRWAELLINEFIDLVTHLIPCRFPHTPAFGLVRLNFQAFVERIHQLLDLLENFIARALRHNDNGEEMHRYPSLGPSSEDGVLGTAPHQAS